MVRFINNHSIVVISGIMTDAYVGKIELEYRVNNTPYYSVKDGAKKAIKGVGKTIYESAKEFVRGLTDGLGKDTMPGDYRHTAGLEGKINGYERNDGYSRDPETGARVKVNIHAPVDSRTKSEIEHAVNETAKVAEGEGKRVPKQVDIKLQHGLAQRNIGGYGNIGAYVDPAEQSPDRATIVTSPEVLYDRNFAASALGGEEAYHAIQAINGELGYGGQYRAEKKANKVKQHVARKLGKPIPPDTSAQSAMMEGGLGGLGGFSRFGFSPLEAILESI